MNLKIKWEGVPALYYHKRSRKTILLKDVMPVSVGQDCLHLTF